MLLWNIIHLKQLGLVGIIEVGVRSNNKKK